MISDKTYLAVVEAIYDAAVDPARWSEALGRISAPMGGGGCLVMHDPLVAAGNVPIFANWDADNVALYNAHYASRNAWLARIATRPVGKAEPAEFFLSQSDLFRTEWYNDFLRPNEIVSGIGVTVMRDRSRFVRVYGDADLRRRIDEAVAIQQDIEKASLRRSQTESFSKPFSRGPV